MGPMPQLYSSLFTNSVLHMLTKFLFIIKENSYYMLPCAFIAGLIGILLWIGSIIPT